MTGYKLEEALGKPGVETFVPSVHQPSVQKVIQSLLHGKRIPRYAEYPVLSKEGTEALLSIGHDLSLARILKEERFKTQAILNSIADGVFTVDRHFRITSFNNAAVKITGFGKEEATWQYYRDILRSSMCMVGYPLKESMDTGMDCLNLEKNILNKENREVHVTFSTAVWRDQNGNAVG